MFFDWAWNPPISWKIKEEVSPEDLVDEHAGEDADEDPDDGEAEHGAEAGVDGSVDDLAVGGGSEDVAKGGWKYCN